MARRVHRTPLQEIFPGQRIRTLPVGMQRVPATPEHVECVQRITLDIFTDMSNAGYALREVLAAIYISGVMHALEITRSPTNTVEP